ncbi:MAG: hypothetical protein HY747_09680, partial [Elusimicrobia bacterium]|nr:hypothetical protein [Elusimicrobiota bacterium]
MRYALIALILITAHETYVSGMGNFDSYEEIASVLSGKASKLGEAKIAVLPFAWNDGRTDVASNLVAERLITKIVALGKVEVVERALLEEVLKEIKLSGTGVISASSAKELGKVLGVSGIVSGTLADLGHKAEINARLIETETGRI